MMQNLSLQKGYTKERSHRLKKEILATSNKMFRLWGVNKQIRESIGHYIKKHNNQNILVSYLFFHFCINHTPNEPGSKNSHSPCMFSNKSKSYNISRDTGNASTALPASIWGHLLPFLIIFSKSLHLLVRMTQKQ